MPNAAWGQLHGSKERKKTGRGTEKLQYVRVNQLLLRAEGTCK